jgi:hypothetical protein
MRKVADSAYLCGELVPLVLMRRVGCALTFASEAKFEIEAKISFRSEAKKKPHFDAEHQKSEAKTKVK